jgi:PBSX family phage terminase large subunit
MNLSLKQRQVIAHWNKEHPMLLINEGAVRSGKTFVNNLIWLRLVAGHENRKDFIITGHTVPSVVRNVLQPITDMFGIDTKLDTYNRFWLFGNRMNVFGGDRIDSYKPMTGMTAHGWYGNEVSLQHENTIQEAFNRCSGEGAKILWDTNPDYPDHPLKVEFIDKSGERLANGCERIKAFHWTIEDNPYLLPEYVENLKKSTPTGMWYDRAIKGLWVAAEGAIYESFNSSVHVIDPFPIPDSWERIGAIDLGFDNPFCHLWGAVDGDKRLYIYAEHYEAKKLLSYHANIIRAGGPISRIVRDHDAQEGAELAAHGIRTTPANKDVLQGIQRVAERLTVQGDGKPRLFIFKACKNLIREFPRYRWKVGKAKEEPIKEDDHAMDALRYMVMSVDTPPIMGLNTYLKYTKRMPTGMRGTIPDERFHITIPTRRA